MRDYEILKLFIHSLGDVIKKLILLVCLSFFLLSNSTAFAIGLGAFLDYSSGSGEAEWDSDYNEWDIDAKTFAGGFVLDTAPTNESFFNYRLNLGIANQVLEDDFGVELDSTGIYAENIFGFAIIQKNDFRWWIGPLVRVGYYSGETDTNTDSSGTQDIDIDYAELGVGGVTGLNFKTGNVIISPTCGIRFSGFFGEGDFNVRNSFGSYSYSEDIEAYATTAFVNIAIMF